MLGEWEAQFFLSGINSFALNMKMEKDGKAG
jgi:hypothetical protein